MDHLPHASTETPASPVPWTPLDVAWALVFFVGWISVVVLISEISRLTSFPIDPSVVVVLGTALLLVPVWFLSIRKYNTSWVDLGLRPFKPAAVGIGCGLMLASLLFNMAFAALLALFNLKIQPDVAIMFSNTQFPLVLMFGGALVAPFVEEVFFRGFVFTGLQHRWGWKTAAVVSSGLFAVAHIVPTSIIPIFILGLIFAYLYRVSNSIWPAILMHMLTNTVALSAAYAMAQGWMPTP
jgi:membrane protease YdiL (CAAX protease family)